MNKKTTKTHTTTSRVGIAIERIVEMDKNGVDHDVVALQMTKNSDMKFTANDIKAYCKMHKASTTKAPITKKQTEALINDQKLNGANRARMKIAS